MLRRFFPRNDGGKNVACSYIVDTLFISDVHLSDERPEKFSLFKQLLHGSAGRVKAVYILGDLFESFWLGNDDRNPPHPEILAELKAYTAGGRALFIIRGNRDLMLDRGIETLTGASLLPDLSVVDLDGKAVLIAHGDVLCTQDVKYQRFRRFMESPLIRWLFLHLPYGMRYRLVQHLTPAFKQSALKKRPDIMDVDADSVVRTMRSHGVDELIHGHTHRPAIHELNIDNKPARRIVLGDWYDNELILVCRGSERRLMSVEDYLHQRSVAGSEA